jgi:two-component system invasion response regulator UvrY
LLDPIVSDYLLLINRGISSLVLPTIWGVVMKIMIVDDHADMRRMLRSIVTDGGRRSDEIIECADGNEAVDQYERLHPDYVLMDVQMEPTNGFTATERIIKNDPEASVIFVTSHNTSAFRTKAKLLHAKGFVTKDNLSELDSLLQSTTQH